MASWRPWNKLAASGLVRRLAEFLFVLVSGLRDAIVFVGPFSQIDELAALAAERSGRVAGVPLMFFAAVRAGYDGQLIGRHDQARLQKVNSNGTSCSNSVDLAA